MGQFLLDSKIPAGDLADKWENAKFSMKLINPANRRKYKIIVVGSGLAGASAASSLAEMGYQVQCFCLQDSPRRAHSIAAQGGINAAKNYPNDGDSIWRLFYDTVKGGDFRAREANVYRLAELSNSIIDQCVAQGVPFAREYSGHLANRSFGGAQVSRTFYARGQTGQQLLLGAYGALMKGVARSQVEMYTRREMQELVVVDGKARGIITRDLLTGAIEKWSASAVVLATGGYGNVFYLSTNAMQSNGSAIWKAYRQGAGFANPCFTQIHPTCIPVSGSYQSKLTLMSESLRNDGRVWVPAKDQEHRLPNEIPPEDKDYFLERLYPAFGNLVPRDVASRNAKLQVDQGKGVGASKMAVYLDFADAIAREGKVAIKEKYGNLFEMYHHITDEDPYQVPMRIYPAVHYTMGGLWVDYSLMSTIPGLFVLGEANFSDHGANRLGASALMQGLADGYFIVPYTLSNYLANTVLPPVTEGQEEFTDGANTVWQRQNKLLQINGTQTVDYYHKKLGALMWDQVGMSRNRSGLTQAIGEIGKLKDEFWHNIRIPQDSENLNMELEKATRTADFLELGELMALDALEREESCGGHFRQEYQTPDNEALRNDEKFCHVAVWESQGAKKKPRRHQEELVFSNVSLSQRSYK